MNLFELFILFSFYYISRSNYKTGEKNAEFWNNKG